MSKVGVVGLGLMGTPIALRLVQSGHDVVVTSRTFDDGNEALAAGSRWVEQPSELADREIVLTMVPAASDVEDVLFGVDGLLTACVGPPPLVVDMSTIGPDAAVQIAERLAAHGGRFADAPVSGGPTGARNGTLAIMVGAETGDFRSLSPVLSALGTPTHLGAIGAGQTIKLANQALIAGILGGIADAYALASHRGVAIAELHAAVGSGLGSSPLFDFVVTRVASGDDAPGFKIGHMLKDLTLVAESAHRVGAETPVAALVQQLLEQLGPDALTLGTQRLVSSRGVRSPAPLDRIGAPE